MSSSCKGSDDTVFGGRGGTGIVVDIEVGMCRFSVDGCGLVGVYEDVHVRKRSIMYYGLTCFQAFHLPTINKDMLNPEKLTTKQCALYK